MLKKKILIIAVFLMSISAVYAGGGSCPDGTGEVWAQHADGSTEDYFNLGEAVYIGGQGFDSNEEYSYELLDVDDGGAVEASGTVWTDGSGNIIVQQIWTIPADDYVGHNYAVEVGDGGMCKCKVVTKKDSFETIPEYPTVMIPAIMSLGGYLALRVKRRNV